MTMRSVMTVLVATAVLGLAGTARAEELVDNPQYLVWAKFKVGTMVKMKTENEMPGMETVKLANGKEMKVEQTLTSKLVEVTPEKVVLEVRATKQNVENDVKKMKPERVEVPAKVSKEKAEGVIPGLPSGGKVEVKNVETGADTLEVAGRKVEATTKDMDVKPVQEAQGAGLMRSGGESHVKVWSSAEVPGGIVKVVLTRERPFKVVITTSVVEMKIAEEGAASAPATAPAGK